MILQLHAYWAVLILLLLVTTITNSFYKLMTHKSFVDRDLRLALFTLILVYIQLFIGLAYYFMSPAYKHFKEIGMAAAMKDPLTRLLSVEHPVMMLLAIVLISIGFFKHKKKNTARAKFSGISIYYALALLFILLRIPWKQWFE